ncbi:MAG TPA: bifunctional (p)ppGpp synthetase/guanosine-3',5'-bis(diphosphate) 3'-pyrophosphohydrolase [Bacillota bacterium]|nr:bifunctional (p)ppGpp synthetase/guanosine-3',5'-bis(diphosphate) 3'-pyrophosphohydrolase [Bacillota bacterium]
MESKQDFIQAILEINPAYDIEAIGKAYETAEELHQGQSRKSGEKYITHPAHVALILAELGMDEDTIIAGLLHDVVEDTGYDPEILKMTFGEEVLLLVDGVTKLGGIKYEKKEDLQAENFRKMFLAMSKDIRVLIIKLADRLHNLRTINYMSPEKIAEKCQETLEIYAPLASRLGIYTIKFELEDIAFKYLEPQAYDSLINQVKDKKAKQEEFISHVMDEIREALDDMGIRYEIMGRSKHLYSIYKKMKQQQKELDEIFDLSAVRVIVETVRDCYAVLGIVHTLWRPIPGKFKDYIAMPKSNMYQSLHTTVIGMHGDPFEIQIRTYEMHKVAEYGIAAHSKYKEGVSQDMEEVKLAWLRQTLEWQKDIDNSKDFMETLKVDLFASQVFVFTPQGDVIELPAGSTPLDFAFKIHSNVGYECIGAKVNGKMVPIDYKLENGNIVEIVTSTTSKGPSIDWLKIVKSSNARNKIRAYLKKENKSDNIDKGKEVIEKYVRRKGYDPQFVLTNTKMMRLVKNLHLSGLDELYTQLAHGGAFLSKVAITLIGYYHEEKQEELKKSENRVENISVEKKKSGAKDATGVRVVGADNLLIRFSKCCSPVPGDEIVGFITKGRGISVHRKDCVNLLSMEESERDRLIDVEWDDSFANKSYDVDIHILAEDRKGMFSDLSKACENMDVHITGVNAKSGRDHDVTNITLTVSISGTTEMEKLLKSFRMIPGVADVYRAIG